MAPAKERQMDKISPSTNPISDALSTQSLGTDDVSSPTGSPTVPHPDHSLGLASPPVGTRSSPRASTRAATLASRSRAAARISAPKPQRRVPRGSLPQPSSHKTPDAERGPPPANIPGRSATMSAGGVADPAKSAEALADSSALGPDPSSFVANGVADESNHPTAANPPASTAEDTNLNGEDGSGDTAQKTRIVLTPTKRYYLLIAEEARAEREKGDGSPKKKQRNL